MLTSEDTSPNQRTAFPISPRGRPARGLYHSPPFHRGQPPTSPTTRNQRSKGRDLSRDSCEDITAYALGVVKSLEIPDDERQEKEEFCRNLDEIVQRIRPSIAPLAKLRSNNTAAKVELFGSFANTFTIANSDIDCCITDPNSTSDELQQSGLPELLQVELEAIGLSPSQPILTVRL
jgi:predicted nucleotidyltransferase